MNRFKRLELNIMQNLKQRNSSYYFFIIIILDRVVTIVRIFLTDKVLLFINILLANDIEEY